MITQILHCPYCQGIDIVKNGKTRQGNCGGDNLVSKAYGTRIIEWHTSEQVKIPQGLHLEFIPSHSPELQPAERLWPKRK